MSEKGTRPCKFCKKYPFLLVKSGDVIYLKTEMLCGKLISTG